MRKKHRPLSDKVSIRVMADSSYQIKRIIEIVEREKGLEFISSSGILKNNRRWDDSQHYLREHIIVKDLKYDKKIEKEMRKRQEKRNKSCNRNVDN